MELRYLIAVDVGTTSVRAALITVNGEIIHQKTHPIQTWNVEKDHYEQSSEDIWHAVCHCVNHVSQDVNKSTILSISFDATCSLVILDENGEPLTVSKTHNQQQNVILWLDHRAQVETEEINATKHEMLKYVGGQVSVEMELPKLKWLKKNLYSITWSKMWRAFDLSDFLTWRCTNFDIRSLCTVTCKWNYNAILRQWDSDFFHAIGLSDLLEKNAEIIGEHVQDVGKPIGNGLTEKAASELNLLPGTVVSTALIDAHAGALGMLGCRPSQDNHIENTMTDDDLCVKLALICGSSTCHMSLTREPCWASGVWGPYYGAVIPDYYLNEGGQSATGLLLDHIVKSHPQYEQIRQNIPDNQNIYAHLNEKLQQICKERDLNDVCYLTKDLHIWPDFHGNRSPLGDSNLRGMITGLSMNSSEESLAIIYLATVQSLAYSTRHIIDTLIHHGRLPFRMLLFCGGLAKNDLYVKCHADICQLPCLLSKGQKDMMLIGTSMLGACAANTYKNLKAAAYAMGGHGQLIHPTRSTQHYHGRKYQVFLEMLQDQHKYKQIMNYQ